MFASSDIHWLEELLYTQESRHRQNPKPFGELKIDMRMGYHQRAEEILEGIVKRALASRAKAEGALA